MDNNLIELAQEICKRRYSKATAAFLAGSFVRGEETKYSDLDVVVVFDSIPNAYRESFIFKGMPVEAFVHDEQTLEYFFESIDRKAGIPSLMQMVVEGIPLPASSSKSVKIKQLAQCYIDMGPPPLTQMQHENYRYLISDLLDDIREPRSYHELTASGTKLFETLSDYYCRANGLWSGKGKSIPRALLKYNSSFHKAFTSSFELLFKYGQPEKVIEVAENLLSENGGTLFDGYRLQAPESWRKVEHTDC